LPKQTPKEQVKKLLTTPEDWLAALEPPEIASSSIWGEERVSLEQWLYEPAFMNLRGIRLSQVQMDAMVAKDDPDPRTNKYVEFVMEWGKGSGKDFISALSALRQCYTLLCLRNPYDYYGLARGTGIQLLNVAYVKEQAYIIYLGQVKGLLRGSPWFTRRGYEILKATIRLPMEITLISAAADSDAIEGNNLFFSVMDEASAFRDTNLVKAMGKLEGQKVEKSADAIYNVLRTSTNSRFPGVGKVVIISYPRYIDDFTQTKRKENEKLATGWTSGPLPTWEVNPRVSRERLQDDYDRNEELALAMYECKPPFAEDGYVKHPDRFLKAVAMGGSIGLVPPVNEAGQFYEHFRGIPGRYYAIHVDLGLSKDRCGLAVARQGEPVVRKKCPCGGFNFKDVYACQNCGRPIELWAEKELPTCVFTLVKQFAPVPPNKDINFAAVREFILGLRERGHFIWALSYDGWQSVDSRQIMSQVLGKRIVRERWADPTKKPKEQDIVDLLSVDRDTEAYDTLKEFIDDERCFIVPDGGDPNNDENKGPTAMAFREWRKLRIINGKRIDHPLGGSKDIIDAMAGAAYWVAQMPIVHNRRPVMVGWKNK
jgi:hypothetical protein